MNSWFDESGQEYGIDTSGMKLFSDESLEFEIPMDSISKETLAELIGGVPIIRCKDCKYNPKNPRLYADDDVIEGYIHCGHLGEDGYCSLAERKEE